MSLLLKKFWQPVAIVAALVFVYANVLKKLTHDWWTDENYSHGLLIPFVIAYIVWMNRNRLSRTEIHPNFVSGMVMALCALLLLWTGTAGAELFTQRMSLVFLLAAIAVYFWGWRLLVELLFPLFIFVMAIPIPVIVLNKIAFPLQLFASSCAVWAMRLFDIPVLRLGNVIELLPNGALQPVRLEVVAACSGIRSLTALITLAALYAYFTYPRNKADNDKGDGNDNKNVFRSLTQRIFRSMKTYGFWRSALIICAAIPIAIITNALRVSGTGVLAHYYGMGIADGFLHLFSGWVMYILAFVLTLFFAFAVDRVYGFLKGNGTSGIKRAQEVESVQT